MAGLKTRRSRRTLFLPAVLVTALRAHRDRHEIERKEAGAAWQEHGLIFPSAVGTPLDPDNFSHWLTRVCLRAGFGHRHPHDLRHSGASIMLALGIPLHVVSEILGHASIAITKDVYGHLVEGEKRGAADAMSAALEDDTDKVAPPAETPAENGSHDGSQGSQEDPDEE